MVGKSLLGLRAILLHLTFLAFQHLHRGHLDLACAGVGAAFQLDVVTFMTLHGVQLLPSESLTKDLPSSLIVPLTLALLPLVEGACADVPCFIGSLFCWAGSCAKAITGRARIVDNAAIKHTLMRSSSMLFSNVSNRTNRGPVTVVTLSCASVHAPQ